MIRFPQDETGAVRKLSRPWHGLYKVLEATPTGIIAEKVYGPQDSTIQGHLKRVTRCPPHFLAGYCWYGSKRNGPRRPPKWLDRLNQDGDALSEKASSPATKPDAPTVDDSCDSPPVKGLRPSDSHLVCKNLPRSSTPKERPTRTRIVKPPNRFSK